MICAPSPKAGGSQELQGCLRTAWTERLLEPKSERWVSEEAIGAEFSPFWWWLADKALLSSTQESHEWLCKQPKREGTFPLAESAVKRFPVTVIAAFGGIISVVTVGRGGKGGGWQGKSQRRLVYLYQAERQHPRRTRRQTQSDCLGVGLVVVRTFRTFRFPPNGQSSLLRSPHGRLHPHSIASGLITRVPLFKISEPAAAS